METIIVIVYYYLWNLTHGVITPELWCAEADQACKGELLNKAFDS